MAMSIGLLLSALLCIFPLISLVQSRPHKHNAHGILLYPEQHEWCETKEVEMVITHKNCQSVTLSNKVCVGQCFSYATPRTRPANEEQETLKYCDQCQPVNSSWTQVNLQCADGTFKKEVEVIEHCSCGSCFSQPSAGSAQLDEDDQVLGGLNEEERRMSRREYMEHARHKLSGEDHGVVASREDVERHGRRRIQNRYRHLDRNTR